ncbi:hypothetical protein A1O3_03247 [Capronia epimyces CBS 606.96]|uniref:Major facilitator superfamily (MFS) profile domain-containing protein n=1 Tax=Capronia epimyces CBS 606.96 TaxID=1182542 RepID=W9YCC2_9EURO|nr:uncharacterized protein A1O3_03247 [Capronia epimyces CBS 606.96]EXJ90178.1 hypothetical protein A1O3_03247 [Capronia epimyces CBS 606.96]
MASNKEEQSFFTHHEQNPDKDETVVARATSPEADAPVQPAFTYWDWQFIVLFLSTSLCFYAGFLGTSPCWNLSLFYLPTQFVSSAAVKWTTPTIFFCQSFSCFLCGRLSDLVGRRWVLLSGSVISFVGFLVAGRASTGSTLVGGIALIGIGSGVQIMSPWLVLAELVPIKHRFVVTGLSMALFAPLLAMFPAIGKSSPPKNTEALVENTGDGWRWCYSINAIFSFVSLVGLFISYHPPTYQQIHEHLAAKDELHKKDWPGLVTLTLSAGFLTYVLLWGRTVYPWRSPQIITLITISGLVLVLYLAYQFFRGNDHAALPAYLIRNRTSLTQITLASMTSLLLWFYQQGTAISFQSIYNRTGMGAAWDISSWSAGLTGGIVAATISLARPRHVKWHIVASTILCMVFLATFPSFAPKRHRTALACWALTGIGQGYVMVITYVTGPLTAHPRDLGLVTGLVSGIRGLGFALFESLFAAIYLPRFQSKTIEFVSENALKAGLPPSSLPALLQALSVAQATGDTSSLFSVPGINFFALEGALAGVTEAGTNAWRFVLLISLVYGLPMMYLSFRSPNLDVYLSSEVPVRLNRPSFVANPTLLGRKRNKESTASRVEA